MKTFLFLFLFVVFAGTATGQKSTRAETDKARQMRAEADRQLEMHLRELEKTDPENAKMVRKMIEQAKTNSSTEEEDDQHGFATKAPAKDLARLNAIPQKILSQAELVQYAGSLYSSLYQKLTATEKADLESALVQLNGDAVKLEDAAIINWVEKAPKGALLFALKAAEINVEEPMYWNNLAAFLNMAGYEDKAIPILRYLEVACPGSAMVYNNLGQAYLGLGDLYRARQFFDSCLKYVPTHPEANHSMGLIYRFEGNKAKSNYHFEQETRVCYRKPVAEELKKTKSVEELYKTIRPRWPVAKNYFTELGLDQLIIPKLPASVDESNKLYQAHIDFRQNVQDELKKWGALDAELAMKAVTAGATSEKSIYTDMVETIFLPYWEKSKQEKILTWVNEEQTPDHITYPTPGSIGSRAGQQRTKNYREALSGIQLAHRREDSINTLKESAETLANPQQTEYISHKYKQIRVDVAIKYCQQEIALADNFLAANASSQPHGLEPRLTAFPPLINEAFFYKSLAPDNVNAALQAHNLVQVYLTYLDAYSAATVMAGTKQNGGQGNIVDVYCDLEELEAEKYQMASTVFIPVECHFKLSIPVVVAKLSIDCHRIKAEGGQGILVGVDHNFRSGNTTLSIGVGVKSRVPFVDIGAKEMAYVSFDRDGNYTDAGMKGEIGATVSVASAGDKNVGPKFEAKAGYQVGVHSGASGSVEAGIKFPGMKR